MKNKDKIRTPFQESDIADFVKEIPFQGYFRIERYHFRHRQHQGGLGPRLTREVFERGQAVAVLPYDPHRDEVVLIEQFRIAPYAIGLNPWTIEVVAGIIDEGETPEAVALRELQEEAGLEPSEPLEFLMKVVATPGGSTETFDMYYAPVDASRARGYHGLAEEGEDIRVFALPFEKAWNALQSGEIISCPAVILLQWLALNRARLRAEA